IPNSAGPSCVRLRPVSYGFLFSVPHTIADAALNRPLGRGDQASLYEAPFISAAEPRRAALALSARVSDPAPCLTERRRRFARPGGRETGGVRDPRPTGAASAVHPADISSHRRCSAGQPRASFEPRSAALG